MLSEDGSKAFDFLIVILHFFKQLKVRLLSLDTKKISCIDDKVQEIFWKFN